MTYNNGFNGRKRFVERKVRFPNQKQATPNNTPERPMPPSMPMVRNARPTPPPKVIGPINRRPRERSVAVVFGTYNRRSYLEKAVQSVRIAAGTNHYLMIVVDGGSTDGSVQWLRAQPDVLLIEQRPPLPGAVKAFNAGFAQAVDLGYPYVAHFNDDAEYQTPGMLEMAVMMMHGAPDIGAVAFEFDLRGPHTFEQIHGHIYSNFGVIRRDVGMAVARAQGDPEGKAWWNPIYKTYAADTEVGCWIWKLGFRVYGAHGLRVHDANARDALRRANEQGSRPGARHPDSALFYDRWPTEASLLAAPLVLPAPDPLSVPPPIPEVKIATVE